MKKITIIKIETMLPAEERCLLEAKFRREYKEGLILLPDYCTGFVTEVDEAVWCATNTIKYYIEHDSGYQEGEENEDSQL